MTTTSPAAPTPGQAPGPEPDVEGLLAWCTEVLGETGRPTRHSHRHGLSQVVRVEADGQRYFAKVHGERRRWEQEIYAYRHWAPTLAPDVPRMVASEPTRRYLLTTALDGGPMAGAPSAGRWSLAAWRAAGGAAAALHALPAGTGVGHCDRHGKPLGAVESDPVRRLEALLDRWLGQATDLGLLGPAEAACAREMASACEALAGEVPVPCHRDFSPRNWIVAPDGRWRGPIDFELAGWELRAVDFCRLWDNELYGRDAVERAFFEGYGGVPACAEGDARDVLRLCYALAAVCWGHRHRDDDLSRQGRRGLRHLVRERSADTR